MEEDAGPIDIQRSSGLTMFKGVKPRLALRLGRLKSRGDEGGALISAGGSPTPPRQPIARHRASLSWRTVGVPLCPAIRGSDAQRTLVFKRAQQAYIPALVAQAQHVTARPH